MIDHRKFYLTCACVMGLVLCGLSFYAGQRFERARLMPIIDNGVRLLASWEADCHCPGPEECSMQATCNVAALHCCFELEQIRGQGEAP